MSVNQLEKLLELYPNEPWNMILVSANPNITWDFIEKHSNLDWCLKELSSKRGIRLDFIVKQHHRHNMKWLHSNVRRELLGWDWHELSLHPDIPWEFIEKHPDLPWVWSILSSKPGITWEFVEKYNVYLDWYKLSENPSITPEIIELDLKSKNPKPWKWRYISKNPSITWEFVKRNLGRTLNFCRLSFEYKRWHWYYLSKNSAITPEIVETNPHLPWDVSGLILNPNISNSYQAWKYIDENFRSKKRIVWDWEVLSSELVLSCEILRKDLSSDKPKYWFWSKLSINPSISWESIENNFDLPWDLHELSKRPDISLDFVEKHSDKSWSWFWLSKHPKLIWDFVEKHPDKSWSWMCLSKHPNITVYIISKNIRKPWDWRAMAENPNLTERFVRKYHGWRPFNRGILLSHPNIMYDHPANPNITWEDVRDADWSRYPEKWELLSKNLFDKHPEQIKRIKLENLREVFDVFQARFQHVEKGLKRHILKFI